MRTLDDTKPPAHARLAVGVGLTAFALYLLSFGGIFHNAADEWLMSAVTESLAKRSEAAVDQMYWVGEYMGWARLGNDGHLYVKYTTFSTGQSLAGIPLYTLARLIPGAGLAQGTLLTNGIVVSSILALLVFALRQLAFSPGITLATVAAFGLGTALWPYSQTYFGEPLLGLAFLLAFYCLTRCRDRIHGGDSGVGWAWGVGVALALAILAKPTGVLIGPFLLGYVLVLCGKETRARRAWMVIACTLPPLVLATAIVAFNTARFGFGEGYLHANSFSTPLLVGLWGLLLSPGRSFFLYSPPVALALPGLYYLWRRDRLLTLTLGFFLAVYLVFFALWSDWYGGRTNWSPRHLVPLIPLLALPVAAFLSSAPRRAARWPFGVCLLAGIAIQAPAVANDYLPIMLDLTVRYPAPIPEEAPAAAVAFASLREAPILQQWEQLSLARSDLAWLHGKDGFDALALGLTLGVLAVASAYTLGVYRRHPCCQSRWMPSALAVTALLAVIVLLPRYADHPRYGPPGYRQALEQFDRLATEDAALVTLDPESHRAFNYQRRANHRYGFPATLSGQIPPSVDALLGKVVRSHDEVWVLATGDEIGAVEQSVRTRLPDLEEWRWEDYRLVRARWAEQSLSQTARHLGARFGGEIELVAADVNGALTPGGQIHVDFYWRALGLVDTSYTVSAQIIGPDGRLVGQADGLPGQGKAPTTEWGIGRTVLDPRVIDLPAQLPTGEYRVLAILYDGRSGRRLAVADGNDYVTVARMQAR